MLDDRQKKKKSTESSKPKPELKRVPKKSPEELNIQSKQLESVARAAANIRAGNAEAEFKNEYVRMLKYNSLLIRRMNTQLQGTLSSRDIYALSTLMSQQREVINDLRTITDMSGQVDMLYQQSVTPFMSDMTQLITDVYYQLRKLLMETTKPKETQFALSHLDELIKQIGLGLQTNHQSLRQSIEGILLGAPAADTVKTKRRKV